MTQTVGKRARSRVDSGFPYVLMYHSVSVYADDPYLVTVDPARFERQLAWLRARGRRGVSMQELLQARRRGAANGLVGLTFDDGYVDFVDNVVPKLSRYGWTATVFVISGRLGEDNVWDPEGPRKPLMTAEHVKQVAAAGMEIGSHGVRHESLVCLEGDELRAEVVRSREALQELSAQPVAGFCYPYGDVNQHAVDAVRASGYDYGTAIWRSPLSGRFALPRTYVGDRDGSMRLVAKRLRHHWNARRDR